MYAFVCDYTLCFRFGRVLPLPSENWLEICGSMFCHGNDILPTGDALSPKVDDCFTSNSDYVLHSSVLLENEILEIGQQVQYYISFMSLPPAHY